VREHHRQQGGQCPLYGEIAGGRLVQAPGVSARLDIDDRQVETVRKEPDPATATVGAGSKMVEVRKDGTLKADAAKKEPR
jgi:hypothetical protein